MVRHAEPACGSGDIINRDAQHRCMCCDGIIANLPDEAFSIGLDLRLGLVSDECALICNDCTARLIEARKFGAGPENNR